MDFFKRFSLFLKENKLISKSDKILVAFSGGKDSVCLLSLLNDLKEEMHFTLAACHIHHGIRGEEADKDLLFCEKFCRERGLLFFAERIDVPSFCEKEGLGLEEGARILRYEALTRVLSEKGFDKIATAHSASDQGETVLFRLIRGSGLKGTCGIPLKRDQIIRPLLPFYSEEILAFLEEKNLPFQKDTTNDDVFFSRNRIRNRILPEMEEISPGATEALARFSVVSQWQTELVESLCNLWEEKYRIDYTTGALPLVALQPLVEKSAGFPVLYRALSKFCKNEKIVISFERFQSVTRLLKNPAKGKIIEIPSAFCFRVENDFLLLEKNEKRDEGIEYQVKIPVGNTEISAIDAVLTRSDKRPGKVENINKNHLIITLAFDKIEGELFARNRKDGDSVVIDNMTRSLKKLFQEADVCGNIRKMTPIICDEKGIVWIPGVGLCDRVRTSDTGEVCTLTLTRNS